MAQLGAIRRIIAVCTGNMCRSPLAEAVLGHLLPGWRIVSAGIDAPAGRPMHRFTLRLAREAGFDLSQKRAERFTPEQGLLADIVLCMEAVQVRRIVEGTGALAGRVFPLSHWRGGADIQDPILAPFEDHRRVFETIQQDSAAWARVLKGEAPW